VEISAYEKKEKDETVTGGSLAGYVKDIFETFKSARRPFEFQWMENWANFLGQYQSQKNWRKETEGNNGRSKVFVKLTSLKSHTAHAKIIDVFGGKVPFDLSALDVEGLDIPPEQIEDAVHATKEKLEDHFKRIELEETMSPAILDCVIMGTAILKGPIVETRRKPVAKIKKVAGIPINQLDPSLNPYEITMQEEVVPTVEHIPIWNYYVDVNADKNTDSIGEIHFNRLLPGKFAELAYQGGYKKEAIKEALERATLSDDNDDFKYVQLGDNFTGYQGAKDKKISVLEYQGLASVKMLKEEGCKDIPAELEEDEMVEAIVVLAADGIVIKACINPLGRRQFFVCPYKKVPHTIYGEGVPWAMRDSQMMINSATRLYIDNKAISGSGMTAINSDKLNMKRTKNLKTYPGKTWWLKGANTRANEAVSPVIIPDITTGLLEMIQLFERFADEETGIPKYTSGTQSSFLNKTAAGMSMLMTQANINLKTVMKNIDNYWIEPIVEMFHQWFLVMDDQGRNNLPMKVVATGTDSLMAKEIKLEHMMKFAETFKNPADAMFMDRIKLMKITARLLDVEEIVKSKDKIDAIKKSLEAQHQVDNSLRKDIDMDRLYPLLARSEQVQVLQELGIKPDPNFVPPQFPPGAPTQTPMPPAVGAPPPIQPQPGGF